MRITDIKALAGLMSQNGLTLLEYSEGDAKLRLERGHTGNTASQPAAAAAARPGEGAPSGGPAPLDFNRITEVRSPVVGVYYSAPSPEAEPFAIIGNRVAKGDVLCIVEAMKLMNEITAECDGEIADICVKNGDVVEFGQVLFKIFRGEEL